MSWQRWVAGTTLWALGLFPLLVLLLLFPDGRLLSPRWRPVLRAGLAVSGLAFLVIGFAVPVQAIHIGGRDVEMRNPLAIPGSSRSASSGGSSGLLSLCCSSCPRHRWSCASVGRGGGAPAAEVVRVRRHGAAPVLPRERCARGARDLRGHRRPGGPRASRSPGCRSRSAWRSCSTGCGTWTSS